MGGRGTVGQHAAAHARVEPVCADDDVGLERGSVVEPADAGAPSRTMARPAGSADAASDDGDSGGRNDRPARTRRRLARYD
jgi:hypothetical protein